jgi:hypothetical protein
MRQEYKSIETILLLAIIVNNDSTRITSMRNRSSNQSIIVITTTSANTQYIDGNTFGYMTWCVDGAISKNTGITYIYIDEWTSGIGDVTDCIVINMSCADLMNSDWLCEYSH